MKLFDKLYNAADTTAALNAYLKENILEILDFNNSGYADIFEEQPSIETFIHDKGGIFKKLDYTVDHNSAFILVLFDICARFGVEVIERVNEVIEKQGLEIGNRLEAAKLYLLKIRKNSDFVDRFDDICTHLLLALDEEDDDVRIVYIFINYIAKVVNDAHPEFSLEIVNKIKDQKNSAKYVFLNHEVIKRVISIDFTKKNNAYFEIQKLIETLFKRDISRIPKSDDTVVITLIEKGTNYCTMLQAAPANFEGVREISNRVYASLPPGIRNPCFVRLKKGVKILDEEIELCIYMYSLGQMHYAKLKSAFDALPEEFFKQQLSIIDWACGQGLATISYLDYLKKIKHEQDIRTITLIEPSELSLHRAGLHVMKFNNLTDIRTLNIYFDEIVSQNCDNIRVSITKMHLFSNVLDIDAISLAPLVNLISSNFPGVNYFVCASPYITETKKGRIDGFVNYFSLKPGFQLLVSIDNKKGEWEKEWTRVIRVFKVTL